MKLPLSHLAGILAVIIWAAIPALVKFGSTSNNLSFLLLLRFLIASLLFLPVSLAIWKKIKKLDVPLLITISLVLGANFYFQGLAMQDLPASWYVVIFSLNPIFALIGLKTKLTRKLIANVLMMFFGTLLFIDFQQVINNHLSISLLYVFIGMLTWVFYTFLLARIQNKFSDIESTGVTQQLALIACLLIWLIKGFPIGFSDSQIPSVIILGLLTPAAYFLFSYCLRRTPTFGVLSQYLEPVFGVLIGFLFLNESLSAVQAMGAILIVWRSTKI